MAASSGEPMKIFLAFGAQRFDRYHDIEMFQSTNDIQTTTMLAIVS
jgi:hypothetical protein